ncbi:MAG: MFS transporter [Oscillospiraceae bacterium]
MSKNNFSVIAKTYMLFSIPFMMLNFLLPVYTKKIGMNAIEFTGLFSLFYLIIMLIKPIIGKISDKIGRKPLFGFSLLLYAVSFFVYSLSKTQSEIYLARIIQSFAAPFLGLTIDCMVADISSEKLAERLGKLTVLSNQGGFIGITIYFFLCNLLISFEEIWQVFFLIISGINLIITIYSLVFLKETKTNLPAVQKAKAKPNFTPIMRKLLLIDFILSLFTSMLFPMFMYYLQDRYKANLYDIGIAYMLPQILLMFLSAKIGKYCDNHNKYKSMLISAFSSFVLFIIFPNLSVVALSAVLYSVYAIANMLFNLSSSAILFKEMHIEKRGEITGIYATIISFGSVIGPLIGGLLYNQISISAPFYACAIGYGIVGFLIFILFRAECKQKIY